MADDLPYYETMYGIYIEDWDWSYGSGFFANTHFMLTKEYLNEGCFTTDYTTLSNGENVIMFLYPHWIKKQYYIEGVLEGQFCISIVGGVDGRLYTYKVRLMKLHEDGTIGEIGSTGTKTVINQYYAYDIDIGVGDEGVYQFYMTISPEKKVLDKERLYVEITLDVDGTTGDMCLYHSNDATWEDFKISIPFRGL
ncbi:MAG: hypothetical protein EHM34_00115 [Nitrosopumilales archaeon]|nr:MAG: hypothetical protein EHM34_00115 [Nitrosopumilales archaeon]